MSWWIWMLLGAALTIAILLVWAEISNGIDEKRERDEFYKNKRQEGEEWRRKYLSDTVRQHGLQIKELEELHSVTLYGMSVMMPD